MAKIFMILIAVAAIGCASQEPQTSLEDIDVDVFYEVPKIAYEELGRVDTTSNSKDPMGAVEKTLIRAADMGADGVIVQAINNKGLVAGGRDSFGTGGGGGTFIYQIQATAIRYVE